MSFLCLGFAESADQKVLILISGLSLLKSPNIRNFHATIAQKNVPDTRMSSANLKPVSLASVFEKVDFITKTLPKMTFFGSALRKQVD